MPCRAVDKRRYKRRNRIETMFGRLKDWRRVATRYDRQMPKGLPLGNRTRRNRHLLAMSPDPSCCALWHVCQGASHARTGRVLRRRWQAR